jgi:3-hydroxyisobutyrate dehydrogenase-like beta-hydroxyacid dehydrogenase
MTTAVTTPVGFIGAGSMGSPMVERLLAAGVPVHLYARRSEVAAELAALGAVTEPSAAAVAAAADIVIVCPFSEDQLDTLVRGDGGLLAVARPGTIIVQHATVSADYVVALAQEAAARDVVLDAPISGTSDSIRVGELTVLLGGPTEAVEAVTPMLSTYCGVVLPTGTQGSASTTKLINNLVFAAHVQVAGAALELGAELGIEEARLLDAITSCSADSFAFATMRSLGSAETFAQLAAPYLRKDVGVIEREVALSGLDTGILGRIVRDGRFDLVQDPAAP